MIHKLRRNRKAIARYLAEQAPELLIGSELTLVQSVEIKGKVIEGEEFERTSAFVRNTLYEDLKLDTPESKYIQGIMGRYLDSLSYEEMTAFADRNRESRK